MIAMLTYSIGALVIGAITATMQGFAIGSTHWLGSAIGAPIAGLAIGWLLAHGTSVLRWMFWCSAATMAITALGVRCAMCWFVGQ
jgi:hypothetical protein